MFEVRKNPSLARVAADVNLQATGSDLVRAQCTLWNRFVSFVVRRVQGSSALSRQKLHQWLSVLVRFVGQNTSLCKIL